jgi:LCP family protein required for cell wall assembly
VDTQGPEAVDPADQWVLDPATGAYQLRLDPVPAASPDPGGAPEPAHPEGTAGQGPSVPPRASRRAAPAGRGGRRAAARSSRRRPKRKSSAQRALVWSAGVLGVALLAGGVAVAVGSGHDGGGPRAVDVDGVGAPALSSTGPMNLLVIGSVGLNATGGADGGADTAVLLHVSADRSDATALSIPGDLVTAVPDCPKGQGASTGVVPGSPVKGASPTFRESLGADGRGAACAMLTVNRLTGLKVDHVVMADTAAVQALTAAAGGVNVCLSRPVSDPAEHLDLAAGPHRLTGAQAVALLRTRNAPPDHSDLDRIRLQQAFLGALLRQARAGAGPGRAVDTLTVDRPLAGAGALERLADDLDRIDPAHLTFAALPVTANPDDPAHATVTVDTAKASQLFSLMARDVSLSQGPAAPDPKLSGPKATPHDTRVTVLNGSGVFGASQDVLNWLQIDKGVNRSANGGDAPAPIAKTVLDYAPDQADQARSLAAMMGLPASALHEGTKDVAPLTYMTLTLGRDYTAPGTPIAPPTTPPKGLETVTAAATACGGGNTPHL